jgi:putative aldouronate transport system permease protein
MNSASQDCVAARNGKGDSKNSRSFRKSWPLHVMVLPALLLLIAFNYIPMTGIIMAFEKFKPWLGVFKSPWIGFQNFELLFNRQDSLSVIWNTLFISVMKIVFGFIGPFVFAILLNEIRNDPFKRVVQTLTYLPHFLSWVILGGILIEVLSVDGGIVNKLLVSVFGIEPIFFLGKSNWFLATVIVTDVWKEFGFGAIIFLAAIAGINVSMYESAEVDGANRFQQIIHITLPSLVPISIVVLTLSLGSVLNAGFDQIFNLYNALVYDKGDIIDTFVYRMAMYNGEYGFATAVGLFKSAIGMFLIIVSYRLAYKFANYRIF